MREGELDARDRRIRQLAVLLEFQILQRPGFQIIVDHAAGRQTGNRDLAVIVVIYNDRQILHANIAVRHVRLAEYIRVMRRDIHKFHRAIRLGSHSDALLELFRRPRITVAVRHVVCEREFRARQSGIGIAAVLLEGELRHMILRRLVHDRRSRSHLFAVDLHAANIHTNSLGCHMVIAVVLRFLKRIGMLHRQTREYHLAVHIRGRRKGGCNALRQAAAVRAGVAVLDRKLNTRNRILGLLMNLRKGQILRRPVDQIIVKNILIIHRQAHNLIAVSVGVDIHLPRTDRRIAARRLFAQQIGMTFRHARERHQTLLVGSRRQLIVHVARQSGALAVFVVLKREYHARERSLRIGAVLVEADVPSWPGARGVIDLIVRHALHQHAGSGYAHRDRTKRRIAGGGRLSQRIAVHGRNALNHHRAVRSGEHLARSPVFNVRRKLGKTLRRILAGIAIRAVVRQCESDARNRGIVHRTELLEGQIQLRPVGQVVINHAVIRRQTGNASRLHAHGHRIDSSKAFRRLRLCEDIAVVRRHVREFHQTVGIRGRGHRLSQSLCRLTAAFRTVRAVLERKDRARQRCMRVAVVLQEADLRHGIADRLILDHVSVKQLASAIHIRAAEHDAILAHLNRPRTVMQITVVLGLLKRIGVLLRQIGKLHLAVGIGGRRLIQVDRRARHAAAIRAAAAVLDRELNALNSLFCLVIQLREAQILRRPVGRRVVNHIVQQIAGHRDAAVGNGHRHRFHRRVAALFLFLKRIHVARFDVFKGYQTVLIGLSLYRINVFRAGHVAFHVVVFVRKRELHVIHRRIVVGIALVEGQIMEILIIVGTHDFHSRVIANCNGHGRAGRRLIHNAAARPYDIHRNRQILSVLRHGIGARLQRQHDRPAIACIQFHGAGIRHAGFRIFAICNNVEADRLRHHCRVAHVVLDQFQRAVFHGVAVGHRRVDLLVVALDLYRVAVCHVQRIAVNLRRVALLQQRVNAHRQLDGLRSVSRDLQFGRFLAVFIQHVNRVGLAGSNVLKGIAADDLLADRQETGMLFILVLNVQRNLRILGDIKGLVLAQRAIADLECRLLQIIPRNLRIRAFFHGVFADRQILNRRRPVLAGVGAGPQFRRIILFGSSVRQDYRDLFRHIGGIIYARDRLHDLRASLVPSIIVHDIRMRRAQQLHRAAVFAVDGDRRRPVIVVNLAEGLFQRVGFAFGQRGARGGPSVLLVQRQGIHRIAGCVLDGHREFLLGHQLAVAVQVARKRFADGNGVGFLDILVPDVEHLAIAVAAQRHTRAVHAVHRRHRIIAHLKRMMGYLCSVGILHKAVIAQRHIREDARPVVLLAQFNLLGRAVRLIQRCLDHQIGQHRAGALQGAVFREVLGHDDRTQFRGVVILHRNLSACIFRHADGNRARLGFRAADEFVVAILVVADIAHLALGHGIAADRQIGEGICPAVVVGQADRLRLAAVRRRHGNDHRIGGSASRQAFIALAHRQAANLLGHRVGEAHSRRAARGNRKLIRRFRIGALVSDDIGIAVLLHAIHTNLPHKIMATLERVAVSIQRIQFFNGIGQIRIQIRNLPLPDAVADVVGLIQRTVGGKYAFTQLVLAGDDHLDAVGNDTAAAKGLLQRDRCQRLFRKRVHQFRNAVVIQVSHAGSRRAPVHADGDVAAVDVVIAVVKISCRFQQYIVMAGRDILKGYATVRVRHRIRIFPNSFGVLAVVIVMTRAQTENDITANLIAVLIHFVKRQFPQQTPDLGLLKFSGVDTAAGRPVAFAVRNDILERCQIIHHDGAAIIQQRIVIGQILILQAHLILVGIAHIAADRAVAVHNQIVICRFAAQNVPYIVRHAVAGMVVFRIRRIRGHGIEHRAVAVAVIHSHRAQIGDMIAHPVAHAPGLRRQLNLIHDCIERVKQVGRFAVIGRRGEFGQPLADGHVPSRLGIRIAPVSKGRIVPDAIAHADRIQLGKALAAQRADGGRLIADVLCVRFGRFAAAALGTRDFFRARSAVCHVVSRLAVGQQNRIQILNILDRAITVKACVEHILGQHQAALDVRAALLRVVAAVARLNAVDIAFGLCASGGRRHIIPHVVGPCIRTIQHNRHHALVAAGRAGVRTKIADEFDGRILRLLHAGFIHRAVRPVAAMLMAAQISAAFHTHIHRVGYVDHQHGRSIRRFAGKRAHVLLRLHIHRHDEFIFNTGGFDGLAHLYPGIGIAGELAAHRHFVACFAIPFGAAAIGNLVLHSHCARTDRQQHRQNRQH